MRLDHIIDVVSPRITHRSIEQELRKLYSHDPTKAEQSVGNMYGYAFRKAEKAYAARGHRGRQDWSGVRIA